MLIFLRLLFSLVLASMIAVTSWASFQCPLFAVPRAVAVHPWFIATLADAYWGFITFYAWVYFKQTAWLARGAWLIAILLLGNVAMAAYCLRELWRVENEHALPGLLVRRHAGPSPLGLVLAGSGIAVIAFAAFS